MGSAPSSSYNGAAAASTPAPASAVARASDSIAIRRCNSAADFHEDSDEPVETAVKHTSKDNEKRKQLRDRLTKCMKELNDAKNFAEFVSSEEGDDVLQAVCNMASPMLPDDERRFVAETFIGLNVVQLWQREWKLYEDALAKKDDNNIRTTDKVTEALMSLYDVLGNCTDISSKMCDHVVKLGAHYDSLRYITTNESDISSVHVRHLTILHNVSQVCDVRAGLRERGAVEKLEKLIAACKAAGDGTLIMVKCLAIIVLAYLVDETESNRINSDDTMIKLILYIIRDAIDNDRSLGFRACEMMNGLNKLAANDANKRRIIQHDGLQYYAQLMAAERSAEDQRIAASGLWTLAYKCDKEIQANEECMEGLRRLAESSDQSVSKEAKGALWILEGRHKQDVVNTNVSATSHSTTSSHQHIMLSYPWFYQSVAKDVCRRLREHGYKVWMDIDDMSGNVLEAMAKAIENAAVVVPFVCQKYKESNNCRAEAEYAFQLQKDIVPLMLEYHYRADGWLGMVLGKKLFIDFCRPEKAQESWQRLLRELGNRGRFDVSQGQGEVKVTQIPLQHARPGDDVTDGPSSARKTGPAYVSHMFDPAPSHVNHSNGGTALWKCSDVQSWLSRIGLAKFSKRFNEFDGRLIVELKDLQRTSPEFFNHSLTQQFNFTLRELLLFTSELKQL